MATGDFTPIAGGTDLIPQMRRGKPENLLDTNHLMLDFIRTEGSCIEIGAGVKHSTLSEDARIEKSLPLLSMASRLVGSPQIRNRGTIAGNVVNASPSADTIPVLLNYDAEIVLCSKSGTRRVRLDEFVSGPYATGRKPDELVVSIVCKPPKKGGCFSFIKLGRREVVNISRMNLAVSLVLDQNASITDARVSAGAVFPVTRRIGEVERLLSGEPPSDSLFAEAGALAAKLMVKESGVRWSTPYKRPVLATLVERALSEAISSSGERKKKRKR
jgi:carbon-monoxide dehydrogenase medium subunit/xanthine dehydrogenase FAD-binding subunit